MEILSLPWKEILFLDLHLLMDKTEEEKKDLRDAWLRDFLYSEFHLPDIQSTGAVFFRSLVRDDYKELFCAVIEASGIEDKVVVEDYQCRSHPPRLNIQASRHMLNMAELYEDLDIEDPLDRACCFIRVCKYSFILEHFRRMEFKALVCFADMQPVEHLLAHYFRSQGVTTFTLQHGLYVDYGEMQTVNVINYKHQPSEYFLSWGPETSNLIHRYHPENRTVDCGKPLIFNTAPAGNSPKSTGYISVFLDQKIFNPQNEDMVRVVLDFARRTNRTVKVRFHPSIRKNEFFAKFPEIKEQLHFEDADFVVGHTSSLLYEALSLGCRVLRYETDIPAIPLPVSCTFSNVEQLAARLELPQPEDLAKQYFCATGAQSLQRYRDVFNKILPELTRRGHDTEERA